MDAFEGVNFTNRGSYGKVAVDNPGDKTVPRVAPVFLTFTLDAFEGVNFTNRGSYGKVAVDDPGGE